MLGTLSLPNGLVETARRAKQGLPAGASAFAEATADKTDGTAIGISRLIEPSPHVAKVALRSLDEGGRYR
jgi:hypothetical protein